VKNDIHQKMTVNEGDEDAVGAGEKKGTVEILEDVGPGKVEEVK
jgi:hypothetical protein